MAELQQRAMPGPMGYGAGFGTLKNKRAESCKALAELARP